MSAPHVVPADERRLHILAQWCPCNPELRDGVSHHFGFTIRRRQWAVVEPVAR